ncbi:MAG TPA: DUF308 domain-containing protein [Anaerolineales bacterium]|nr:DUF308 domain-containing protein [Anaerolineales bacterium]
MFAKLFRNWWMYAVRGLLAVVFGILALIWPGTTKSALVLLFGAFALMDGIFATTAGLASSAYFKYWWAVLLEGLAGMMIGLVAFALPDITALALLYLIAAWAIITGIFEIVAAIEFRHVIPGERVMFLVGLLSTVLGILLFVFPGAGLVGLIWAIGIYAIVNGIMEVVFAFRLHSLGNELKAISATV